MSLPHAGSRIRIADFYRGTTAIVSSNRDRIATPNGWARRAVIAAAPLVAQTWKSRRAAAADSDSFSGPIDWGMQPELDKRAPSTHYLDNAERFARQLEWAVLLRPPGAVESTVCEKLNSEIQDLASLYRKDEYTPYDIVPGFSALQTAYGRSLSPQRALRGLQGRGARGPCRHHPAQHQGGAQADRRRPAQGGGRGAAGGIGGVVKKWTRHKMRLPGRKRADPRETRRGPSVWGRWA